MCVICECVYYKLLTIQLLEYIYYKFINNSGYFYNHCHIILLSCVHVMY